MPGSMHPNGSDLMRAAAKLALVAGCLALGACAAGPRVPRYTERFEREVRTTANPGSVVATDIGFSRAAREDGQWSAFRDYAADGAVIHGANGPVDAASWLARRADPAVPKQWTPLSVWSSCDGQTAISQGKYADPNGEWGYYVTAWERQRDYDYKYVYDLGAPDAALSARENESRAEAPASGTGDNLIVVRAIPMIAGEVADCPTASAPPPPLPLPIYEEGTRTDGGASRDGTLVWRWVHFTDGRRLFVAHYWQDAGWREAVRLGVTADGRFERES